MIKWIKTCEALDLFKDCGREITRHSLYSISLSNGLSRRAPDGHHREYDFDKVVSYIKSMGNYRGYIPDGWIPVVDFSTEYNITYYRILSACVVKSFKRGHTDSYIKCIEIEKAKEIFNIT